MSRRKTITIALGSVIVASAIILALFWILNADRTEERHNRVESASKLATLLVVMGGIAVAWYRSLAAHKQAETAEQGQITDRFTKAVEQLAHKDLPIRLGGIYALEKIAEDAPERYHWTVVDVLCACVREWTLGLADGSGEVEGDTKSSSTLPKDIGAILTVLKRRGSEHETEDQRLNLRGAHLHGADLTGGGGFRWADFSHAKLTYANFGEDLHLTKDCQIDASATDLTGAVFAEADLSGADLGYTNLTEANFFRANLTGANLAGAVLTRRTRLGEADLSGAQLENTDLRGVNLSGARNVTWEQIDSACGDENTELRITGPKGEKRPAHWTTSESKDEPDGGSGPK